jgi:hypothetical protein
LLVAVEELDELLAIEPAVAVPDQLDGDDIDARVTGVLTSGKRRQRTRVGARQVPPDIGDLGSDQVEVVEKPIRGRYDELARADIFGERAVRRAEHADVVIESRKRVFRALPRVRIDRQAGRQRERAGFQPLDAEQFVAQRPLDTWRPVAPRRTLPLQISSTLS